jgi:hypothetical protein
VYENKSIPYGSVYVLEKKLLEKKTTSGYKIVLNHWCGFFYKKRRIFWGKS